MLKIKDDADLKELEKFGFYECDNSLNFYLKEVIYDDNEEIGYFVRIDTRIIEINSYGRDEPLDNTIYDLIKANLVEKVEDNK